MAESELTLESSGIIEIEGDLYQLPLPASALEKNSWKLSVTFPSEIEPGDCSGVHFSKGEKGFLTKPIKWKRFLLACQLKEK